MSDLQDGPLKVWLVTDVFPPGSGGSGWSTYYLGKALADLGHTVRVLRPVYGTPSARPAHTRTTYGGLGVEQVNISVPPAWATKLGLGRAWEEEKAVRLLTRRCLRTTAAGQVDIFHGQHLVSGLAASLSARKAQHKGRQVASVVTIRDYWPLCPSSTRLFPARAGGSVECADCHDLRAYTKCLKRMAKGGANPVARLANRLRWLGTRRAARMLSRCDAIIGVSNYVRAELERSRRFDPTKLHTVHNLVDLNSVDKALVREKEPNEFPAEAYILFAGKLDEHKGAQLLPQMMAESGIRLPVLFAGDGPLQPWLELEAATRGLDFRFLTWLDNDAVLRLMRGARCLLFPSCWQEPLSRVLLEGCAAGAAIVALDSGGTSDIITHHVSGWLAQNQGEFIEGVRRVCSDDALNSKLRIGARQTAGDRFSAHVVARQVEDLYRSLLPKVGTA